MLNWDATVEERIPMNGGSHLHVNLLQRISAEETRRVKTGWNFSRTIHIVPVKTAYRTSVYNLIVIKNVPINRLDIPFKR